MGVGYTTTPRDGRLQPGVEAELIGDITRGMLWCYVPGPSGPMALHDYGPYGMRIAGENHRANPSIGVGKYGRYLRCPANVSAGGGDSSPIAGAIRTGDFTIAARARLNVRGGYGAVFQLGVWNTNPLALYWHWQGTALPWLVRAGATNTVADTLIPEGVWLSLIAVRRAGVVSFYLNGEPDGVVANAGDVNPSSTAFFIGEDGAGTNGHDMDLDFCAAWNHALALPYIKRVARAPWSLFESPSDESFYPLAPGVPVAGPPNKVGNSDVVKSYVGDTEVIAEYVGNTKIWPLP